MKINRTIIRALLIGTFILGLNSTTALAQEEGTAQSLDSYIEQNDLVGNNKEEAKTESAKDKKGEEIVQDESTLEERIKLAREYHQIRPTREQVDGAIRRASNLVPPSERDAFISAMMSVLNYNAIEKISVDAMAEIFTVEELRSMVEYYKKPEAQSAVNKSYKWAEEVQPEIMRMIDKAMMKVRTGGTK